jgi:hypothetical protein
VEKRQTKIAVHVRQRQGRRAQFQIVDEHRLATEDLARTGIPRSRLIDTESAQSICAAGEKSFRKRNQRGVLRS